LPNIISSLRTIAQDKIRVMQEAKKLAAELSGPPEPPKTRPRLLSEAELQVVRKSAEGIAKQAQSPELEMMRKAAESIAGQSAKVEECRKAAEGAAPQIR
jgi:hypothetical protein